MQFSSGLDIPVLKGTRIYQYLAGITGTLGIVSSEMHYGWPSPSLPILTEGNYTIQITNEVGSWLAVIPLFGAIVGAMITGVIIDIVGRKNLILFSSVPFFISWLLIGFAKTVTVIFVARFMAGMTDGLSFTAVPIYLGEIADPQIRGFVASLCPVSIVFGILLINILGCFLPINTAAFASTAVPMLLFVTFLWMPESPYFLLMRGREKEAKKSLQVLRGVDDVEEELRRLSKAVQEQNQNSGKFIDLFTTRSNRKAVIISLGLRTVQQWSGTTAITFYCKTIFEEAGGSISANFATVIYFTIQLILSSVASLVVDISGRRPLLIISVSGTALSLLSNAVYLYLKTCTNVDVSGFSSVPLITLICFVVIFSIGLQTIPLLVMSEMFPTNVKAFALCLADIYFSIIASVISKFFQATNDAYGMHVPFFTFAACCVVGLVFIIFYVPETKGKTLEDIQCHLKGEHNIDINKSIKPIL